jgi:hypothetical protein
MSHRITWLLGKIWKNLKRNFANHIFPMSSVFTSTKENSCGDVATLALQRKGDVFSEYE